jgi:hypothetical protein
MHGIFDDFANGRANVASGTSEFTPSICTRQIDLLGRGDEHAVPVRISPRRSAASVPHHFNHSQSLIDARRQSNVALLILFVVQQKAFRWGIWHPSVMQVLLRPADTFSLRR